MFGKSSTTRVNDTITYIQNCALLTGPIRVDIVTFLNHFVTNHLPRATRANRRVYSLFSANMSVAGRVAAPNRGALNERHERRAIYLLWKAMGQPHGGIALPGRKADEGMTLPPAQVNAAFQEAMMKAACHASQVGMTHVFTTFFDANPLNFIQNHKIFIRGSTGGSDKYTDPLYVGTYQNFRAFHFQFNCRDDRFEFAQALDGRNVRSHQINVVSVPAIHWSEVPGRSAVPVPANLGQATSFAGMMGCEVTGAPYMITTQFTGCSFCYMVGGGEFYAAHISPADPRGALPPMTGGGQGLANQIMGNQAHVAAGDFANWPGLGVPPAMQVFGNGAGNAAVHTGPNAFYPPKNPAAGAGQMKWMSIFGKDYGGTFRLFTQSVDGVEAILEARRIL